MTTHEKLQNERYEVAINMEKYGGSFVQALSVAIMRADPVNLLKLYISFPDLWEKYLNFNSQQC